MADYNTSPVPAHPKCRRDPPHSLGYFDILLPGAECPKCIAEYKAKDDANKKKLLPPPDPIFLKRFDKFDPISPMFSKWFDDLSHEEKNKWLKKNGDKQSFQDWLKKQPHEKRQRFSKKGGLIWNYKTQNLSTTKTPSFQPKQKKSVHSTGTTTQANLNIPIRKPTTSKRGKGQGTRGLPQRVPAATPNKVNKALN